jgi:prepilin-type N-terminal cleavage/methylation domain-containing protein
MMRRGTAGGFTLIELLVSMTIMLLVMTGLAKMMVQTTKINKAQQMTAQIQADARNSLSMIEQRLRSAGWDPANAGIATVVLDTNPGDGISEIEVFADLDADGDTDTANEQTLIRHTNDQIVWRPISDPNQPFVVLASNISNDANGDGTIEPMFVPDSTTNPTRVRVQITAQSAAPNPMSGEFIRYTVTSDVVLRDAL